jgi:hypothetical protein
VLFPATRVAACVLIATQEADPLVVVTALRALPHVTQAHMLLGPTDCMAYVECVIHDALRDTVMQIRARRA